MAETEKDTNVVELATELTIAWLSNPNTRASSEEVPSFLKTMHDAVRGLTEDAEETAAQPQQEYIPATTVRKSLLSRDYIISMIDGKPYKTLRRHLAGHGMTPEQYRERYNLKRDYPMVAESYAEKRRELAKQIGLGRKGRGGGAGGAKSAASKAANGRRSKKSDAASQ